MNILTLSDWLLRRFKILFKSAAAIAFMFAALSAASLAQSGGGDVGSGSTVVVTSGSASAPRKGLRIIKPAKRPVAPSKKPKVVNISPAKSAEAANKTAAGKNRDEASGGENTLLNADALMLPLPVWSRAAQAANAEGLVEVVVNIDEEGNVVSAVPRTGDKLLWESAEKAALQAKFNLFKINGKPVKRSGYLVFCFGNHPDCQ